MHPPGLKCQLLLPLLPVALLCYAMPVIQLFHSMKKHLIACMKLYATGNKISQGTTCEPETGICFQGNSCFSADAHSFARQLHNNTKLELFLMSLGFSARKGSWKFLSQLISAIIEQLAIETWCSQTENICLYTWNQLVWFQPSRNLEKQLRGTIDQ